MIDAIMKKYGHWISIIGTLFVVSGFLFRVDMSIEKIVKLAESQNTAYQQLATSIAEVQFGLKERNLEHMAFGKSMDAQEKSLQQTVIILNKLAYLLEKTER